MNKKKTIFLNLKLISSPFFCYFSLFSGKRELWYPKTITFLQGLSSLVGIKLPTILD